MSLIGKSLRGYRASFLDNKTERQTEYLYRLLETAGKNMGLLC